MGHVMGEMMTLSDESHTTSLAYIRGLFDIKMSIPFKVDRSSKPHVDTQLSFQTDHYRACQAK